PRWSAVPLALGQAHPRGAPAPRAAGVVVVGLALGCPARLDAGSAADSVLRRTGHPAGLRRPDDAALHSRRRHLRPLAGTGRIADRARPQPDGLLLDRTQRDASLAGGAPAQVRLRAAGPDLERQAHPAIRRDDEAGPGRACVREDLRARSGWCTVRSVFFLV